MKNIKRVHDLTGQKFGRLTVIGIDEGKNTKKTYWICQCDCGRISSHRSDGLLAGTIKSCGCYKREGRYKGHKKPQAQTKRHAAVRNMARHERPMLQSEWSVLQELGRSRHCDLWWMERRLHLLLYMGDRKRIQRIPDDWSDWQQRELHTGKLPVGISKDAVQKQKEQRVHHHWKGNKASGRMVWNFQTLIHNSKCKIQADAWRRNNKSGQAF